MPNPPYTLTWLDRRGAGRAETSPDLEALGQRMAKLRCEATLRDAAGEMIGEVTDRFAYDLPGNGRWVWWYDPDARCATDPQTTPKQRRIET